MRGRGSARPPEQSPESEDFRSAASDSPEPVSCTSDPHAFEEDAAETGEEAEPEVVRPLFPQVPPDRKPRIRC